MHFFGKIGLVLLKDLIISRITKIHLIVTKRHKKHVVDLALILFQKIFCLFSNRQ